MGQTRVDGASSDAEVHALVREHWSEEVDRLEALPAGRCGRHWTAFSGYRPLLFVTLSPGSDPHLEASYAAAADLAFALDVVIAGLPSHALTYTVAVPGGLLSIQPWVHGQPSTDRSRAGAEQTARLLLRLHAVRAPRSLPRWEPPAGVLPGERPWVVTHGAPDPHHQLITPVRTVLVDWSAARLAPRERDLVGLVRAGHADLVEDLFDPDPALLEHFAH